ncbi:MAG: Tn3 family transposase [Oligoflexia bacterium]|nr:Tn3 family transposase [Oligoflexia bacterium]
MPTIRDTAYPRIESSISKQDMDELYTPTQQEMAFCNRAVKGFPGKPCFLLLLKSFQKLGYFPSVKEIPFPILECILKNSGYQPLTPKVLKDYDHSGTRSRHMAKILNYLGVKPFKADGKRVIEKTMRIAIESKDDLVDLINISLEELIRLKIELPGFFTILEIAKRIRFQWGLSFFEDLSNGLTPQQKKQIDALFVVNEKEAQSDWEMLKEDSGNPSLPHLKELLKKLKQLKDLTPTTQSIEGIPCCKIERFGAEARVSNAYDMMRFSKEKRYSLAICLLQLIKAQVLDDLGEMLVKKMRGLHNDADESLSEWRKKHQSKTDELISKLGSIAKIFTNQPKQKEFSKKVKAALGKNPEGVLKDCESYASFINNNYFSFILPNFASSRKTLFDILEELDLVSTSSDNRIISAIRFIQEHRKTTDEKIFTHKISRGKIEKFVDLEWVPDKWWKTLTGQANRDRVASSVDRKYLEVCVFSQIAQELQSGDLAIVGAKEFADYRRGLISKEEAKKQIPSYSKIVDLPLDDSKKFIKTLKDLLHETASTVNNKMPANEWVTIEDGKPSILRGARREQSKWITNLERTIVDRLPCNGILDVLTDTEKWLHWTKFFKPISGRSKRIHDSTARYLSTVFCYGCNLGPNQTERSLKVIDRKKIAWIHQKHISEAAIENAITEIINSYNQFELPKHWGIGTSASADGTKWDLRDHNLLSEYHIRYGGYGGIGYYHVADSYIALFSRFIPCGVWEATYIFDGLLKNESEIKPDTLHGDTQAQNATVFAFAYLLGINLMPRIRNWKDLKLYKASATARYPNIDAIFTRESIDWHLIETHLDDMLRVILSIKAGKIIPSTILRKLNTKSKKNKLYFAFRELGRVIRTIFLLKYLDDRKLRTTIQAATNKSESFNSFAQWVFFGGNSLIKNNDRDQQRKIIKYNHLVVNLIIFHTVQSLTNVVSDLFGSEGATTYKEVLARISPYIRSHINRFGDYQLDLSRPVPPLKFAL